MAQFAQRTNNKFVHLSIQLARLLYDSEAPLETRPLSVIDNITQYSDQPLTVLELPEFRKEFLQIHNVDTIPEDHLYEIFLGHIQIPRVAP